MNPAIIIGIVAFLLLLFNFYLKIEDREHIFFRFLLIIVFFNLLLLMAKSTIYTCEYKAFNSTESVTGINETFTENNYKYICAENPDGTGLAFFTFINRLYYLVWAYIIVFISYKFLQFKGIIKGWE